MLTKLVSSIAIILTLASCLWEPLPNLKPGVVPRDIRTIRTGVLAVAEHVSMAWNGTEWGIVWSALAETSDIYFISVANDGIPLSHAVTLLPGGPNQPVNCPALRWAGDHYVMAYLKKEENEFEHTIGLAQFSEDGSDLTSVTVENETDIINYTDIALEVHNDSIFLLYQAYANESDECIHLLTAPLPPRSSTNSITETPQPYTNQKGQSLAIVWDGTHYLAAWFEDDLYYTIFDDATPFGNTTPNSIEFDSARFALAYSPELGLRIAAIDPDENRITLHLFDPDVAMLSERTFIPCQGTPERIAVGVYPSGFSYCWTEKNSIDLYFAY